MKRTGEVGGRTDRDLGTVCTQMHMPYHGPGSNSNSAPVVEFLDMPEGTAHMAALPHFILATTP